MISYMQLEKFYKSNLEISESKLNILTDSKTIIKKSKKLNLIEEYFKTWIKNELNPNFKIANPFSRRFFDASFNEEKLIAMIYLNQFLETNQKILNEFNNFTSCSSYFEIQIFNKNSNIYKYFTKEIRLFTNSLKYKNKTVYDNFISDVDFMDIDLSERILNKYLILIEDFIITENKELYFKDVINIKSIYIDFIDYVEETYNDPDKNIEIDNSKIDFLRKDPIIIDKYSKSLFNGLSFEEIVDNFKDENNDFMIFSAMREKYINNFLLDCYEDLDLNLYSNYYKSEVFNSSYIIYKTLT